MKTARIVFVTVFLAAMIWLLVEAWPHDWYSNAQNPKTGEGCCGGEDCFALNLEDFVETKDAFIVTLSVNRGFAKAGVPYIFPKSEAQETRSWKEGETGYHACVLSNQLPRCFFYPTGA
jgi:hypothetical protein